MASSENRDQARVALESASMNMANPDISQQHPQHAVVAALIGIGYALMAVADEIRSAA